MAIMVLRQENKFLAAAIERYWVLLKKLLVLEVRKIHERAGHR